MLVHDTKCILYAHGMIKSLVGDREMEVKYLSQEVWLYGSNPQPSDYGSDALTVGPNGLPGGL